ncbi:MAG: hypothetical protein QOE00_2843 [Ilumatobacteraceae bacterium]
MDNKRLAVFTAVGLAAAIAVPTIAFGNARRNEGTQHEFQVAEMPLVTRLSGLGEVGGGDPDGAGAAAVTIDITTPGSNTNGAEVCWDLSYTGLTGTPTFAHIHRASNSAIVVPFTTFPTTAGASSATGCSPILGPQGTETVGGSNLAAEILANPGNFYVNVHTTDHLGGAIRGTLAAGPVPAGEAHLLPEPLRAYDSRDAAGARIGINETRTINLATGKNAAGTSVIAVPPGATAAIVTLTVTDTTAGVGGTGGFLKAYSAALATPPATSSINWTGVDQNIAVNAQVAVDASGQIKITDGANATHFVVDVVGFLF